MFRYKNTYKEENFTSLQDLIVSEELRSSVGIPTIDKERKELSLVCEKELTKDEQETLFLAPAAQNNKIT